MPNVTEHTITNIPELRTALITGVKVYHFSAYWQRWSRVLNITDLGYVREIDLTPGNPQWMTSWTKTHCAGRIREHITDMFQRGDKLVIRLPIDVMQMLEQHHCLHLVDESLFS
jgi:hypothetical protein